MTIGTQGYCSLYGSCVVDFLPCICDNADLSQGVFETPIYQSSCTGTASLCIVLFLENIAFVNSYRELGPLFQGYKKDSVCCLGRYLLEMHAFIS